MFKFHKIKRFFLFKKKLKLEVKCDAHLHLDMHNGINTASNIGVKECREEWISFSLTILGTRSLIDENARCRCAHPPCLGMPLSSTS